MGELMITFDTPHGEMTLPQAQVIRMGRALKELDDAGLHPVWHVNECGCCVSVHGTDNAGWVIGDDGGATRYGPDGKVIEADPLRPLLPVPDPDCPVCHGTAAGRCDGCPGGAL